MDLKDYPISAVNDIKRTFVRFVDRTLMCKVSERRTPLYVSEKEVGDCLKLPFPFVREVAAELAREGELEIRPGLNYELYKLI